MPAQNISTGIVEAVSRATSGRLSEAAGERGARLTPAVAAVTVLPRLSGEPLGAYRGAVVFFATGGVAEELGARGLGPSRTGLWTVRLLLGFVYAALVAGVELWVAFSLVGVEHEASTMQVHLFLAFAIAAVLLEPVLLLDGRERLLVGWAVVVGREV